MGIPMQNTYIVFLKLKSNWLPSILCGNPTPDPQILGVQKKKIAIEKIGSSGESQNMKEVFGEEITGI